MSVATATELWRLSATELAEAIRSRQVSSHEVTQAHLRRIEAMNPSVNAVTVVLAERVLPRFTTSRAQAAVAIGTLAAAAVTGLSWRAAPLRPRARPGPPIRR